MIQPGLSPGQFPSISAASAADASRSPAAARSADQIRPVPYGVPLLDAPGP